MSEPDFGAYNLWDALLSVQESDATFKSAIPVGEDWLVAGETVSVKEKAEPALLLTRMDSRGREIWNRTHAILGLIEIRKMLPHKKGALVLGSIRKDKNAGVWIGIVGPDGELLETKTIAQKDVNIHADDVFYIESKDTYALAAHVRQSNETYYSRLYLIDGKANTITRRSLNFGADNQILSLAQGPRNMLLGLGKIKDSNGRDAALAIGMANDLKILWQKTYPRGFSAYFKDGAILPEGEIVIAAGAITPSDREPKSAWIARINAINGDMEWERYFRGTRIYEGTEVLAHNPDLATIVLRGYEKSEQAELSGDNPDPEKNIKKHDFARIITMSKRGVIVAKEDHLNAKGLIIEQLVEGPEKQRLLVGETLAPDTLDENFRTADNVITEEELPHAWQGWMAMIPAAEPYTDPCDPY
jgi:hypothetical protein